jgi:undecaprenyl pyrophosphate phosphatase UppP
VHYLYLIVAPSYVGTSEVQLQFADDDLSRQDINTTLLGFFCSFLAAIVFAVTWRPLGE